jgi:hypothetical protein
MAKHTIELTEQELLILNEALVNLPFKIVAPVIQSINKQLQIEPNPTLSNEL